MLAKTDTAARLSFQALLDCEKCPSYQEAGDSARTTIITEALTRCGLEYDYITRDFDGNYPGIEPTLKAIASPPVDSWVLLSGITGSGKTTLLANMIKRLFVKWALKTTCPAYKLPSVFADRVRFVPFAEFRSIIRVGYDDAISAGAEGMDLFKTKQLLIMDDMIDGDIKPYDYLRLSEIFSYRYDASDPRLPVWISTNLSDSDLRNIPDFARTYSRLADTSRCQYVELTDADRRP